ncbi:Ketoacyl-ACP synthase III [Desulfarculales bacterium]
MSNLIMGTSSYVPARVVTNQNLLAHVDLNRFDSSLSDPYPQWGARVMDFEERRWVDERQAPSDLGHEAARRVLADASLDAGDSDFILVTTITSNKKTPNTASILQDKLGAGGRSLALADNATSVTDFRHYTTSATFGDGADARVLSRPDLRTYGILGSYANSDGAKGALAEVPAGGSTLSITCHNCQEVYDQGLQCFQLQARDIKDFAIEKVREATAWVLKRQRLALDDVAYVLPHQAGRRILEGVPQAMGLASSKVLSNYQKYGNISQASIPILLDENRGLFREGDKLVLTGEGVGFGWGAMLYTWRKPACAAMRARRYHASRWPGKA